MWKLLENLPGFTYWKSVFLDIFCPVLTMHLVALENVAWAQPDHRKFVLDPKVSKIKSLDFFPIFLTNRVWTNQAKSWKWVMFKTLLCQPTWFQMYVLYTIWKYTWSAMIWAKKILKSKIHILSNYEQTDLKTALVPSGHFFKKIIWVFCPSI